MKAIPMNVVWVREIGRRIQENIIEWVFYTSLDVSSFKSCWNVLDIYASLWLIEEFHKALKSGCRVTERQLKNSRRIEAMLGVMTIVAARLLQLKSMANADPDSPARTVVPPLWLTVLKAARKNLRRIYDITIKDFYFELAKLGGLPGRNGDGNPGWITIWRGWEQLHLLVAKRSKCVWTRYLGSTSQGRAVLFGMWRFFNIVFVRP